MAFESFKKFVRGVTLAAGIATAGEAHADTAIKSFKQHESPAMIDLKERSAKLKFSNEYSEAERVEIRNFIDIRIKIAERMKELISSGTLDADPSVLIPQYNTFLEFMDEGIKNIEQRVSSKGNKFTPPASIENDPMSINIAAHDRLRSFIENARAESNKSPDQEDAPASPTETTK